jgi:hypothetical protein
MKKTLFGLFAILITISLLFCQRAKEFSASGVNDLRAPAYPLITIDPYTSIWSFTDELYEENVMHWTGTSRTLIGALKVDGKPYRFMGKEESILVPVLFTGDMEPWDARFTEEKPASGWKEMSFDDSGWKEGKGGFSSRRRDVVTRWASEDIWVRREFTLDEDLLQSDLILKFSYDDLMELYINGNLVIKTEDPGKSNIMLPLSEEVMKTLVNGKNIITAHCTNADRRSFLDFGLFMDPAVDKSFETTAVQKTVNVMPTQTFYEFECGPVQLELIFTSPLLMDNLDLLSRPINYITWQVKSLDGQNHDVQIYFEASPEFAVNKINQSITSDMFTENGLTYLKTGTIEQPVLEKSGDNLRIDWGYFYLTSKTDKSATMSVGEAASLKNDFISNGKLSGTIDKTLPEKMYEGMTALSYSKQYGDVGSTMVGDYLMIGYDDLYSIQYFGDNLPAYWTKGGTVDIRQAFSLASQDYADIMDQCSDFDSQLMEDAEAAGGKKYADMCALSYRQSISAHKLVKSKDDELLFLSKENNSNGSIGTVDVTYPSSPLYLIYNPDLLKGMLNGIFYYSESGKWTKPFAAHDIGTYPLANGQTYGRDMPVEEAGNMLVLTTAIAAMEGNADYAEKHWETLSTWANYLLENGLDPEEQLCTDDFAGHLAHNANLSVKAIMGIAGYGKLAGMLGKNDIAEEYTSTARGMALEWIEMDKEDDHFRLTFDQPDTWSQKYNLVWDKILDMEIFPVEVSQKEIAYYLTKQLDYGLPLDSRKTYTKSDWVMWTATLAGDVETFQKLSDPIWKYCNETESRVPLSDWHETTDGKAVGFKARSVVGGYFMKLLEYKTNME